MCMMIEGMPVTSVHFTPNCIVTVNRASGSKYWMRPKKVVGGKNQQQKGSGAAVPLSPVREMRSPRMEGISVGA